MSSETRTRADDGDATARAVDDSETVGTATARPRAETTDSVDDGMGRRGWVLVAVVVTCFLVVPGVIYLRPATPADAGLPFLVAMLALPMLPALLLGLTAVWSMTAGRQEGSRR